MNTLDLIVVSVVGLSALFAFVRGFVREALSIVAWIGAGLVAYYGFARLAPTIGRLVPNPLVAQLTTGGLLFVVSLLVFSIIVGVISDRVRTSRLGSVDRSLGLVFGLARGALVVCLGYLVTVHVIEPNAWPPKKEDLPAWIADARSKPYLEQGATPLMKLLPPQLLDKGTKAAGQAEKTVESAVKADEELGKTLGPAAEPPPPEQHPAQPPAYDESKRQDMTRKIDQLNDNSN